MKNTVALCLLAIAPMVFADEAGDCSTAAGTLRTGVVTAGPTFVHGQFRQGVELSHTHLTLLADQDGESYDVAIDNVFAAGFDQQHAGIPAPLDSIKVSDRIEVCGQLYTKGVGIHWVHTNCGIAPAPAHPDGWLKPIGPDGGPGANYEGNTTYCKLF